eukprot:TRINITY_DN3916_c0_g1_i1.p1 TRINITY_DN3916_c0_g1~~TRINITY_DN3916_c0_g1_i1.p1  ORF type:complete len:151 (-),score=36.49 TRINITY_DN3916_c0_g1_i1:59-469(-)
MSTQHLSTYLFFCCAVNLFRTVMNIFKREEATKAKIDPKQWEKPEVRELAYAYTKLIGLFMSFRAFICAWAAFLEEEDLKKTISLIVFVYDVWILSTLVFPDQSKKVLVNQQAKRPLFTQSSLVVSGLIALALTVL